MAPRVTLERRRARNMLRTQGLNDGRCTKVHERESCDVLLSRTSSISLSFLLIRSWHVFSLTTTTCVLLPDPCGQARIALAVLKSEAKVAKNVINYLRAETRDIHIVFYFQRTTCLNEWRLIREVG